MRPQEALQASSTRVSISGGLAMSADGVTSRDNYSGNEESGERSEGEGISPLQ